MSVENFIPELTRAEVQVAYDRAKVVISTFAGIPEGEIRTGNAVKIVNAAAPTEQDYKAQGRKFTTEELAGTDVTVLIDQEKATSQLVDDIDARQAAGSLTQYTDLQGVTLARGAERHAINTLIAGATLSSATAITTAAHVKTQARALASLCDAAEVPEDNRFLLVNVPAKALLIEALGDSASFQAGSGNELRKNQIGEFAGFKVIWSPLFDEKAKAVLVAYSGDAVAFADQISKTQAVRAADSFSDVVSSLAVYGAKVTRPAAVHLAGITNVVAAG